MKIDIRLKFEPEALKESSQTSVSGFLNDLNRELGNLFEPFGDYLSWTIEDGPDEGGLAVDDYQEDAARTLIDSLDLGEISPENRHLVQVALTTAGLFGAQLEAVKKGVFHQHGIDAIEVFGAMGQALVEFSANPGLALDQENVMVIWNLIGLIGEATELLELVAEGRGREAWLDELGDCAWYLAALATKQGLSLSEVMGHNIEKLKARYPEGFSYESSKNRTV